MTAELAMARPLLVLVTAALAWCLAVGADQVRLVDAAREVARSSARGDTPSAALATGRRVAPEGTEFTVREEAGLVVVEARSSARPGGWASALVPDVGLRAEATALTEATG